MSTEPPRRGSLQVPDPIDPSGAPGQDSASPSCVTCGTPLTGRYCHACGELAEHLVAQSGAADTPEREAYARRFDESTERYANSLVILMVPLFALVLALLYWGHRPFVHHTVMALHFHAFMLLVMIALPLLLRGVGWAAPGAVEWLESDPVLAVILTAGLGLYIAAALRRGYGDGRAASLARGLVAVVMLFPILTIYRMILFFAVYVTLD